MAVAWSSCYLRPDQFLDHLTVIISYDMNTVLIRGSKMLTLCRHFMALAIVSTLAALGALLNGRIVKTKNVQVMV